MREEGRLTPGWEIVGLRDGERFLRALPELLSMPTVLVFEGVTIARDVRELLESAAIPARRTVPAGTLWPCPTTVHVAATRRFLAEIADLAALHAEPELCDHLHAYDDEGALLQWYDAFSAPLLVAASVPEERVERWCAALGAKYRPR